MRAWFAILLVLCLSAPAFAQSPARLNSTVIRMTSEPSGANVIIDGTPCGTTPATVGVTPGRHEVVVEAQGRRIRSTVTVAEGEMSEVHLELDLDDGEAGEGEEPSDIESPFESGEVPAEQPPPAPAPAPAPALAPATAMHEGVDDWEGEARSGGRRPRRGAGEVDDDRWHRRVYQWPLFDLRFETGVISRSFAVPISESIDTANRDVAGFESDFFGLIGFRVSIFPLFLVRPRPLRGLGFEVAAAFDTGLTVLNRRRNEVVDAHYYECEALVAYRLVLGRPDAGAALKIRFGWHRTDFFLGDVGNDIVPPFTYDTLRIDAGVRVPLGTRHLLAEVGVAYLAVMSVGSDATMAYNESGHEPSANGAEVRLGMIGRLGGFELGWIYVGRFYRSHHQGVGMGWGVDPSTRIDTATGQGIQTTDTAKDDIHEVRLTIGYRW